MNDPMCINLSWNGRGQRCQRNVAQDATFLEVWGKALQEAPGTTEPDAVQPVNVMPHNGQAVKLSTAPLTEPTLHK